MDLRCQPRCQKSFLSLFFLTYIAVGRIGMGETYGEGLLSHFSLAHTVSSILLKTASTYASCDGDGG